MKLNRLHWELITVVAFLIIFGIVLWRETDKSYTSGWKDGLQRGNDDCNTKITQSQETISKDAKEKQTIDNETGNDAYDRFKRNTNKK